jgi:transcriptional regulator with GAF, ATPase, and Fis domain
MDSLFRKLTLEMCDGDAIEQGLHRALLLLREHFPVDQASLTVGGQDDRSLARVVAEADATAGRRVDILVPMATEAIEWAGQIHTDDVMIINRPDEHPLYKRIMPSVSEKQSGALMMAPLGIGKRPVGALTVFALERDCYTEEHAALLKAVNEPFAIALAHWEQRDRLLRLQQQLLEDRHVLENELWGTPSNAIMGEHFGLKHVMAQLRRVAPSSAPVLLLGETGVGKDVLANALHRGSPRASGPFVKMNCGATSENLIDSELFGHEAGSFTGARMRHRGRFERAQAGTLFLDEIGELPPAAQLRLLRVLQHGEFERVGGTETIKVDVRVVAATHRDLSAMVAEGGFREDLWFRLNVFPVRVPPLRERREDIPVLVHHILQHKAVSLRKGTPPELAAGSLEALMSYDWPGNVRELENVLERALIVHESGALHVAPEVRPSATVKTAEPSSAAEPIQTLDDCVAAHIRRMLERTGGKIHGAGGAAELLGVRATTLRNRMDKLGVSYLRRPREPRS